MTIRIWKKKYTIMIIPESGGTILNLRVSRVSLYFLFSVLLILSAYFYTLYTQNASLVMQQNKLVQKENELKTEMMVKERTIDSLSMEIETLLTQADQIQAKVDQLKALEDELRGIVDQDLNSLKGRAVSISSAGSLSDASVESMVRAAEQPDRFGSTNRMSLGGLMSGFSTGPVISPLSSPVPVASLGEHAGAESIMRLSSSLDIHSDHGHGQGGPFYPLDGSLGAPTSLSHEIEFARLDHQVAGLISAFKSIKLELDAYIHKLKITPTIYPTDSRRITSGYGTRLDPFTKTRSFHSGIDIGGPFNSEVYATADGTVSYVGRDSGKGNYVVIDHAGGLQTRYMHLNKYTVKRKQEVSKGDVIGYVGSTGRSTGPHLHYEVLKKWEYDRPDAVSEHLGGGAGIMKPHHTDTIIGECTEIRGSLHSEASIRVEGKVFGEIRSAGSVTIGRKAYAESDITADQIIIVGTVNGNMTSRGKLIIRETGRLYGNHTSASLLIEKGGVIAGARKAVEL